MGRRKLRPRRSGPEKGTEVTRILVRDPSGQPLLSFRKPQWKGGRWRVSVRNFSANTVTMKTLDALNQTAAREEVAELAARARENARAGEGEITRIAVKAAMQEWLLTLKVQPGTQYNYESQARVLYSAIGPEKIVCALKLRDMETLLFKTRDSSSAATKIRDVAFLRRFLQWCEDHDYVRPSPMRKLRIPDTWWKTAVRDQEECSRALTFDQARKLLIECGKRVVMRYPNALGGPVEKDNPFVEDLQFTAHVALLSGLRLGNLCGRGSGALLWNDLKNLDISGEEMIEIPSERMKNGRKLAVPIHPELVSLLRERLRAQGQPGGRVIPGAFPRPHWDAACRRAGLEGLRFHDCRHSFASWVDELAPFSVGQALLGHSRMSGSITKRYVHPTMERMRLALSQLPNLLQGEKKDLEMIRKVE